MFNDESYLKLYDAVTHPKINSSLNMNNNSFIS